MSFCLLVLYAQVTTCYQTTTSASLLYKNSAFWVASGEVMRGGDGMEVIMATKTTKVKKMDDNCTVKRKNMQRAHKGAGRGRKTMRDRELRKREEKQVRKQGLEHSRQKKK